MKARTILCPIDFSSASLAALTEACSMAEEEGSSLIILHVIKPVQGDDLSLPLYDAGYKREMLACLKEVAETPDSVPADHRVVFGNPSPTIVRIADEEDLDLIVMGTHGRSGFRRLLLGSVAEAVVRSAPCPVLTIREVKVDSEELTAATMAT
jgi:nucleotide-binding universal stress UspA family protein